MTTKRGEGTVAMPRRFRFNLGDLFDSTGGRVKRQQHGRISCPRGKKAPQLGGSDRTTMSEHEQPVAANVLARQFAAKRPNQRWVGDTTKFVIGSSVSRGQSSFRPHRTERSLHVGVLTKPAEPCR